ncbi:MAG: membrane dipeptidase [Polyangiales bacterium]
MTRIVLLVAAALAVLASLLDLFGPTIFDRAANRVYEDPPYAVSARGRALYEDLFVVDMHADSLLWERDLSDRLDHGSIDIPRLIEGNVAIQSFFIVTKTPWITTIDQTSPDSDAITTLIVAQDWPEKTRTSLLERALYQASRLHELAEQSEGRLRVLKTKADLDQYREARKQDVAAVAGILGVEGAHVLEGDLANLEKLYHAGVRIVAPTHFFDNEVGGSAHGVDKGGLTALGRDMVREMEDRGMLLDLAHASPAVIDDATAIASRPVIVSHTGVRGTCDNNRNLSDAALRAVTATGGVIGIGYWKTAVCGEDAASIARAIVYAANLVGAEHIALGSDFDGAVPVPFDTTGLALIVDALLDQGMNEEDIRLVMGENAARVFAETLPD